MEIIDKIRKLPDIVQSFAKRSKNLFPPIAKDCIYRLLVNKITWIVVAILLLPCILGVVIYFQTDEDRQVQESNGEKIYYDEDGDLIHEDAREEFLNIFDLFVINNLKGICITLLFLYTFFFVFISL